MLWFTGGALWPIASTKASKSSNRRAYKSNILIISALVWNQQVQGGKKKQKKKSLKKVNIQWMFLLLVIGGKGCIFLQGNLYPWYIKVVDTARWLCWISQLLSDFWNWRSTTLPCFFWKICHPPKWQTWFWIPILFLTFYPQPPPVPKVFWFLSELYS